MTVKILKQYEKDGFIFIECTKDGTTVSHIIKQPIPSVEPVQPQPSLEEQILAENQYQTMLLEISLGGM